MTDAKGRIVNFKNTVVIITSNLGSELLVESSKVMQSSESFSLSSSGDSDEAVEGVIKIARGHFKPEFLNRIDEIIIYNPLSKENIASIVGIQLAKVVDRLAEQNIKIEFSDKVQDYIAEKGFDPVYGARPLKCAIQTEILDPLAMKIVSEEIKEGEVVKVRVEDEKIKIK